MKIKANLNMVFRSGIKNGKENMGRKEEVKQGSKKCGDTTV